MRAPNVRSAHTHLFVHEDREDASVKATGKWKATLVTVAAASSVALATGAGASAIDNHANADIDQNSSVETWQASIANSGFNHAKSWVDGENLNDQSADGSANDGNITNTGDDGNNTAGNLGAPAENTNSGTNDGTSDASADSGNAKAENKSDVKVSQNNGGDVEASASAHGATISGGGGIDNTANLDLHQDSWVGTKQIAVANSGFNYAKSGVSGFNGSVQTANGSANGGDISNQGARGTNLAGNSAGAATNTNTGSNTGKSSATASSGDATASNSSKVNVSQNNSGSVKADTNADGATLSGWSDHNKGW
jgi:hypothetical protein